MTVGNGCCSAHGSSTDRRRTRSHPPHQPDPLYDDAKDFTNGLNILIKHIIDQLGSSIRDDSCVALPAIPDFVCDLKERDEPLREESVQDISVACLEQLENKFL